MTTSKKRIVAIVGILAAFAMVATLAYFFKEVSVDNPFSTKEYGGTVVEKFTPEKDWEPGEKVTKEVKATNTGDYALYVRVKFNEKWTRDDKEIAKADLSQAGFFPENLNKTTTSSVYKEITTNPDWVLNADGYYYYKKVLAPKTSTPELMTAATLCKDADMGSYIETMYYAQTNTGVEPADGDWTTTKPSEVAGKDIYQKKVITLDPKNSGLAGANYVLTITTEFCQADEAAAEANHWKVIPQ